MNDEELIARARQLAEDGVRSAEAQALARELLRQLADRLDGHAAAQATEAPTACPNHRSVLDSDVGWYCPTCGSAAPPR